MCSKLVVVIAANVAGFDIYLMFVRASASVYFNVTFLEENSYGILSIKGY